MISFLLFNTVAHAAEDAFVMFSTHKVWCPFKPPAIGSVECPDGYICKNYECQKPALGSSADRVVCTVKPPGIGAWLCEEGEECVDHKCVKRLGASANPVSGLGGKCGFPGNPGGETYDCDAGLVCNRHGKAGGYGTCEQAPLGSWHPARSPKPALGASSSDNNRVVCTVRPPGFGAWLCEESEDCINHECVPSLGIYVDVTTTLGSAANPVSGLGGKCGFPGYPGGETYDCEAGLVCNRHGKAGGYGTCEQAKLGRSGGIHTVGVGGRCELNGMNCQVGLECTYNPNDPEAGAYGTCESALGAFLPVMGEHELGDHVIKPVLGERIKPILDEHELGASVNPVSGLGGKCGFPGYLDGQIYDCEAGLVCIRHEKRGRYGICVQAALGSSGGIHTVGVGGRCELNGMNCQVGLECTYNPNDPEAGAYGICERALGAFLPVMGDHELGEHVIKPVLGERIKPILGASANPVSGLGGKCGFPGYLDGQIYDCEAGLVCIRHEKRGGYGICVQAALGSSGGIHTVGVGGRCELNGMNCQIGLECSYNPNDPEAGAYGICESALGAFLPVMGEHELGEHVIKPVLGERIKPILDEHELGEHVVKPVLGASANPVSGLGGKCGFPGYLDGQVYNCEAGLVCIRHEKRGGYGICVQAALGSSGGIHTVGIGGRCELNGMNCKVGLECTYKPNDPEAGAYGICERALGAFLPVMGEHELGEHVIKPVLGERIKPILFASSDEIPAPLGQPFWPAYLGASANPVSGLGGKCGFPGYPGGETYDCEAGLVCNRHGKAGGYGTCEHASLGSWHPARSPKPVLGASSGYSYCQQDSDCPSSQPICHHPGKEYPDLMPSCIADDFGAAPLGGGIAGCMTDADCPTGKSCVNPLVMGAPVEGWCM